jgi:hypothetical protein
MLVNLFNDGDLQPHLSSCFSTFLDGILNFNFCVRKCKSMNMQVIITICK